MDFSKPFDGYDTGADCWRDTLLRHGINEAPGICRRYFHTKMKSELPDDEKQFCRALFAAMYETTADKIDPAKLVYPYALHIANDRAETSYFHKNQSMNQHCARAIDEAISASEYETCVYHLELAAMSVVSGHGFERVNAVLAHQIQNSESDGRYATANKKWAKGFTLPDKAYTFLKSHATLIDGFTACVRKLYEAVGAARFALPGHEEHGESEPVHGYEIVRSILIDKNQGYAIGHNPHAADPFVCWQFYIRDGERGYNWGIYGDERAATDSYNARLFVAFN